MKKNVKAVIACTAALVIVGGAYTALMLTDKTDSEDDTPIATVEQLETTTIFSYEKAEIESVTVENSNGGFKAYPLGEPEEDGTVTFTIEGIEDLNVNYTLTSSVGNNSSTLNSDSTVEENATDLEKYGLASPQAKVTVKTASESKTILVGNESPVSGETYCMVDGENTVYLVTTSSISVFTNADTYFISNTILSEPSDDEEIVVEKLTVERADLDYNIVLEYDKTTDEDGTTSGTLATHYMTEPVFAYLDVEKSQDAIHGLYGLTSYSVLTAHPTEEEISSAGLDKPFCTITMDSSDGKSYTLKLGDKMEMNDSIYYPALFEDDDVIYCIDEESLCWATLIPDDIMSRIIFGTSVWDIGTLEIDVNGGENVTFEGSGTSADDYKVTKNGKETDTERFRSLYKFILKTSAEEFVIDEQPQGEPIVTINLKTQDGKTDQTVEFYETDSKKVLISVNGVACFKCREAYVDLLIENLEKYDSGEEFVMNW